jgi:hypothetical protein
MRATWNRLERFADGRRAVTKGAQSQEGLRMFTTLRKFAGGTAVIPMRPQPRSFTGTASLRKELVCRQCGRILRLVRINKLSPHGVRGSYIDDVGHFITIDRSFVSTEVGQDAHRIYFR